MWVKNMAYCNKLYWVPINKDLNNKNCVDNKDDTVCRMEDNESSYPKKTTQVLCTQSQDSTLVLLQLGVYPKNTNTGLSLGFGTD